VSKTAVHIGDLSVYYGPTPALAGVCLDVSEGAFLGIIGPNGGGKSTLLKAILGLVPISSGTIEVYGKKPGEGACVGYVPQFGAIDRKFPISVLEVVLTGKLKPGLTPFFRYTKRDADEAREILEKVGLKGLAGRQISALSGGEFQKMLVARALIARPKLLLLDEPTASVDAVSREQIYSVLVDFNREMTIILVTHDLLAISAHVHELACLNLSLVYHGGPTLTEDVVSHLYGCPVDLIAHGVPHRVLKEHGGDAAC
jgi:zinc transport system ATP-binding protein